LAKSVDGESSLVQVEELNELEKHGSHNQSSHGRRGSGGGLSGAGSRLTMAVNGASSLAVKHGDVRMKDKTYAATKSADQANEKIDKGDKAGAKEYFDSASDAINELPEMAEKAGLSAAIVEQFSGFAAEARKAHTEFTKADKSIRATLIRDVLPAVRKKGSVDMVDIRGADEYNGKIFAASGFQELAIRAGHIPGAVNVPWGANVNSDGTFKTVAELKKLYADKGIDGKKTIITYCRIGERSSLTWFVLSEILGYDVKNYDGSWTEYGNSVGNPINNPAGTIWGAA
jgi:rhodanese-related sulfurtransferase